MGQGQNIIAQILGGLAGAAGAYGDYSMNKAKSKEALLNDLVKLQVQSYISQSDPYKKALIQQMQAKLNPDSPMNVADLELNRARVEALNRSNQSKSVQPSFFERLLEQSYGSKLEEAESPVHAADVQRSQLIQSMMGREEQQSPIPSQAEILKSEPAKVRSEVEELIQSKLRKEAGIKEEPVAKAARDSLFNELNTIRRRRVYDPTNKDLEAQEANAIERLLQYMSPDEMLSKGLIDKADYEAMSQSDIED